MGLSLVYNSMVRAENKQFTIIWLAETTCRYMHTHTGTCTNAIDRWYNVIGGKAGLSAVISARISTGKLRDIGTKAQPER